MAVVEMERRGSTAIIRLNRPEARNAISPEVSETMVGILDEIEADDDLRVVVLTGTGEVFSAGADLKVVAQGRAHRHRAREGRLRRRRDTRLPEAAHRRGERSRARGRVRDRARRATSSSRPTPRGSASPRCSGA